MMERQIHRGEIVVLFKGPPHQVFRATGLSLRDARCETNWDRSPGIKSDNLNRQPMFAVRFYPFLRMSNTFVQDIAPIVNLEGFNVKMEQPISPIFATWKKSQGYRTPDVPPPLDVVVPIR